MMLRLLPLAVLIALGLAGFAALAMWQLNRLGRKLGEREQQVQTLECEDPLTALPNHNYFFELLDDILAERAEGETLAFLSVDLDGFDEVNDMLGRAGAEGRGFLLDGALEPEQVADAVVAGLAVDRRGDAQVGREDLVVAGAAEHPDVRDRGERAIAGPVDPRGDARRLGVAPDVDGVGRVGGAAAGAGATAVCQAAGLAPALGSNSGAAQQCAARHDHATAAALARPFDLRSPATEGWGRAPRSNVQWR